MILENSVLVGQDGTHVISKGLHVLGNEDSVLLCLVPKGVKAVSESEHRVLEIRSGTGWGRLHRGRLWWWWVSRGLPNVTLGIAREYKTGLIFVELILVQGLIVGVVCPPRSWYTRFVTLDRYSLNGVYPRLIVL